jgi:resuscitation-promoting factor RpfA
MAESEDRDFDALLSGHADVRAAYRLDSVGDEPGAALDAAILAASRKAVKAGPERIDRPARFVRRLAVPLSAAAVMVLATSLSFLVYEEHGTPSAPGSPAAVRAPAPAAPTADNADGSIAREAPGAPAGVASDASRAKSSAEVRATPRSSSVPMSTTTDSAPSAPEVRIAAAPSSPASTSADMPAAPAAARPSDAFAGPQASRAPEPGSREEREAASPTRAAAVASDRTAARDDRLETVRQAEEARAEAQSDSVAAKRLAAPVRERAEGSALRDAVPSTAVPGAEETPAEWIARVRALAAAGRIDAARAEVARLRCRYPDVTVPPDLPAPEAGPACPPAAAKEGSPDLR